MNPILNRMHLQAIYETELSLNKKIGLLAYILIPISLNGVLTSYSDKAYSTLYANDLLLAGNKYHKKIHDDEILKYNLGGNFKNLITPDKITPFTKKEIENLYGVDCKITSLDILNKENVNNFFNEYIYIFWTIRIICIHSNNVATIR